jgi:diguanylate cyclase (GGDEF)-like protein
MISLSSYDTLIILGVLIGAFVAGARLMATSRNRREGELMVSVARLKERLEEQRISGSQVQQRCRNAEEQVSKLQRSIVEMPEIAQRLSATRDLREIPDRTLDLVQETFDPSFSVFYRSSQGELVAVSCRGESEFSVGHRMKRGDGVVGWAAIKQLPFTDEDAMLESSVVRERNLSKGFPQLGFAACLPIVSGEDTIGVILIGPSRRNLPHLREIGRTIALIASVSITSAIVLKEQKMLAKTDGLTGLLNRTHLLRRVRDMIASDSGSRQRISLFLFDLDHFKHYNDTNGHLPGDELLQSLSELLREQVREGELLGRYGGEEFLLVMPRTDKVEALRAAQRVRALIADHVFPFEHKQPGGNVTISGGVATWPLDSSDLESLIRCADEALYQAKHQGRDRVLAFTAPELAADDATVFGETDLNEPDAEKEESA